jgi:N-methylhydantoinase B
VEDSPLSAELRDTTATVPEPSGIEPFLMAILSNRLNGIAAHMTHVLEHSARSSVMSSARDLSTAICDSSGAALALPNGFPVHVANMSLTTRAVMRYHGTVMKPGDAYLNNSPYDGNTHMADHTIVVPVFCDGELMFFCTVRGHQADIGNSVPTTYFERARDIYEEGAICFPCVKVQENYEDREDIIRMAKYRIRVPDVWYGDYLAMIGAARVGERQLTDLVETYGRDLVKRFCAAWQDYGARRMIEEIGKLPAGSWTNESRHDPIPGLLPSGIQVRVTVTIRPEDGVVEVDFRGNGAPVACGLNLCEATVLSAARTGIMNRMPADIPFCDGALERISVFMDNPGVVGAACLPFSSSVATTNVANRAILAVQCVWSQVSEELGMAEGNVEMGPGESVISGFDSRYQRPFVTQLLSADSGGMAVFGHDGYVDYGISNGGMCGWNSVEVIEQKYPILYLEQEVIPDSGGTGRWDGAPATRAVIATREDPVTFMYIGDGAENVPKGYNGGGDGRPTCAWRLHVGSGREEPLPMCARIELKPGEALVSECNSGGGYGDPLERDRELVCHRVNEGWVTPERARTVYGVLLDVTPLGFAVNIAETERLRDLLRSQGPSTT